MAQKVIPHANFDIVELDNKTKISVNRKNIGCMFIPGVLFFFFIPSCFVFAVGIAKPMPGLLVLGILGLLLTVFCLVKLLKKKTTSFFIDNDGITVDQKIYIFDEIKKVGYKNHSDGNIYNPSTFRGNIREQVEKINYGIYIVYGTQEIPLVPSGLNEHEVSALYDEFKQICSRYGHIFS